VVLIQIAFLMTDFSQDINWGFKGSYLAAMILVLNAIGALMCDPKDYGSSLVN